MPTPVAVAVSDFCRRAGAPASPTEVRDALSALGEDEDFRVRTLTDTDPQARPLGPLAVVDVLRGTSQALAATRQTSGYYDLARALMAERERTTAPVLPSPTPAVDTVPQWESPAASRRTKEKKPAAPTMQERIAPKKRQASEAAVSASEELPALEPGRDREKPQPKGRFANISPSRQSVDDLFRPDASEFLRDLIAQHPDRYALTRALGEAYRGKKEGQPLRTEDLERALGHHKLMESLETKEREAILGAYQEQRGASGKVAFALGLSVSELNRLVRALGITKDVEQVRERFRREALSPKNLGQRLDLLGRGKYLSDLGIRRRFDDALKGDLRKLLKKHASKARGPDDLVAIAAKQEGTQAELLSRALAKLELTDELGRLAGEEGEHAT